MNVAKISKEKIILELSKDELGVLSNALNEVCNGIEVWEFETRIGITSEDAKAILKFLTSTYKKADQARSIDEN